MSTILSRLLSLRKPATFLSVLWLMCLFPGLLLSESQTMTTYYPAPYGGYVSILTTDKTLLARDGGNVGIGTPNPVSKLDVNGSANVAGDITATQNISGANVLAAGKSVITTINCPPCNPSVGPCIICTQSGNTLNISLTAQTVCAGCSATDPACGKTTYGVDSCNKPCTKVGAACACVPNGTCSAAVPACDQTAYGVDNCGALCVKTGVACPCINCSATTPLCGQTTTGIDSCGKTCTKVGTKCTCVDIGAICWNDCLKYFLPLVPICRAGCVIGQIVCK